MARIIDGEIFRKMIIQAACAIEGKKLEANELNVFPVPDGDTGTNMSLTMLSAYKEMEKLSNPSLGQAAEKTASALLRGARGNSGVILSLLFRGIARQLKDCAACGGEKFASALAEGVSSAYQSVMKPAEGTILTVSRRAAEAAAAKATENDDIIDVFAAALETARIALKETTSQNPVLAKAGVVDSGGFGFVAILDGMFAVLNGKEPDSIDALASSSDKGTASNGVFSEFDNDDIKFMYCTEFIASRENKDRSVNKLRLFLQNIGDSAVVVADDEIVKVHVHTNRPDKVLAEALRFGALVTTKIENMKQQHTEKIIAESEIAVSAAKTVPNKKYGFVAIAAGDGLSEIFKDAGVDNIVSGGQTMNPSTEDILVAAEKTPAEIVYVLPNNKNIIMAAEQAATLCQDKRITVIPTATIPQGISALLAFDESASEEENQSAMLAAVSRVKTGQLTYAVRDSEFDGKRIKAGDYIALLESKLHFHGKSKELIIKRLIKSLAEDSVSFITVFYGADTTEEEANSVAEIIKQCAPNADVSVLYGGQPVYYYIISAE